MRQQRKSRWLLATGVVVGAMMLINASQARAGQWQIVPSPVKPNADKSSPEYQTWLAEAKRRYEGKMSSTSGRPEHSDNRYPDKLISNPDYNASIPEDANGVNGNSQELFSPHRYRDFTTGVQGSFTGGAASAKMNGSFSVVLRYVQDPRDEDQSQANRDKPFFIKVEVRARVEAYSQAPSNSSNTGEHNSGEEHATLTLSPSGNAKIIESSSPDSLVVQSPPRSTLKTERKIFLVQVSPQGKTELDKEIVTFNLDAHIDPNRSSIYTINGARGPQEKEFYDKGSTLSWISYDCRISNTGLYVSSNLEPTYHKVTSASELPTKIDPNNGQTIHDGSKIRFASTDGPWAVQNGYDDEGAGQADTVAIWNHYQNLDSGWFGGATFQAHASGFNSPDYIWSRISGAVDSNNLVSYEEPSLDFGFQRDDNNSYRVLRGISLGGDKAGKGMTESSTATVGVSDANLTLTSDYTINWHLPDERWEEDGDRTHPLPSQLIPLGPYAATGANIAYRYTDKPEFDYRNAGSIVSGITGVGAAAVTLFAPEATFTAAVLGFISATAGAVEFSDESESDYEARLAPRYVDANYTNFQTDVLSYYSLGPSDPNANGTFEIQGNDPDLEDAILQSLQGGSQEYFNGSHLSVTLNLVIKKEEQFWNSDGYDAKGYQGEQTSVYRKVIKHQYNRIWRYNDTRPTGGTQGGQ